MTDADQIGELRVLSDGRSVALLAPDATYTWWCTPRVDAAPTLWSLLGPQGARCGFAEARPLGRSPDPAGPVTWTRVRTPAGTVEVRDGIVDGQLLRVVTGIDADLDVCHVADLGGFDGSRRVTDRVQLRAGKGAPVGVVVDVDRVAVADAAPIARALDASAIAFARESAMHPTGPHLDRVYDAFAVMRSLRYAPTGAVAAAATTSIPETPGTDRQFDYRFAWLRDGALAASVAALYNQLPLADDFLRFVENLGDRIFASPLFTVDGGRVPAERDITDIETWSGAAPVRIGNAAVTQVQFDALGFVVEAVSTFTREGGRLRSSTWQLVRAIADRCCDPSPELSNGIWEFRQPVRLLSADIGRFIALDRALRVAKRRRPWASRKKWHAAREEARARVLRELRPDGRLPQFYGGDPDTMDASGLLVVMFGIIDSTDPRSEKLVDAHLERLTEGDVYLRRYPRGCVDGFTGDDFTFTPCSWWAVTALSAIGRHADAHARADRMCRELPRLLAEEYDPVTGTSHGNTPLVWSHAEAARALRVLHVADVQRQRGRAGVLLERVQRSLSHLIR